MKLNPFLVKNKRKRPPNMGEGGGNPGKGRRPEDNPQNGPEKKRQNTREFIPLQVKTTNNSPDQAGKSKNDNAANTLVQVHKTIHTENMYNVGTAPLSDFEMTDDDTKVQVPAAASATKPKKIAPIIVTGTNASDMQNLLNTAITSKKFSIKILGVGIRIDLVEKTDFDLVKTHLNSLITDKKINGYYNYHTPDTRPHKMVLYGLYKMETKELEAKLKSLNIIPSNIATLRLGAKQNSQTAYLLYFAPGTSKLSELRKIKHIDNIIIRWERFEPRKQDKIPQCRNCQMFGHSSVNCSMPSRCLVCGSDHTTETCPKKIARAAIKHLEDQGQTVDRTYIQCANCGDKHTASYRGCIARKAYIDSQANRKTTKKQQLRTSDYRYTDTDFPAPNWATLPTVPTPNQRQQHNLWSEVLNESNDHHQFQQQQSSNAAQMQLMTKMLETMDRMMSRLTTMLELVNRQLENTSHSNSR